MKTASEHIRATTTHTRLGEISHTFSYGVDYVLVEPEAKQKRPLLFSRNHFNLMSVHDSDHGGPQKQGQGAPWARKQLEDHGLDTKDVRLFLLTQPRCLGYVFNPVSFWLAYKNDDLIAVISEVSTPFGDRHSYLCTADDQGGIVAATELQKPKQLHVSPYQEVKGGYRFKFDIRSSKLAIRILHENGNQGLSANLIGKRSPLTSLGILAALARRPFGAMRTIALIYWQALRLKLKGATYRRRPEPPKAEVS